MKASETQFFLQKVDEIIGNFYLTLAMPFSLMKSCKKVSFVPFPRINT